MMNNQCVKIHHLFNRLPRHSFPFDRNIIPKNGIYILFEKGEFGHDTDRIVRIGTHTGLNQLPSRLIQHFINENKDRSIFRKNIGRAILNRDQDTFLKSWELDLTTRRAKEQYASSIDFTRQRNIESQVSNIIQNNFSFVVFEVTDKDQRLALESKIISTVSHCRDCQASSSWLGNHSTKDKIRTSGLWLVNELGKEPLSDLDLIELIGLL
jgi:hypothetical protein